ncbi:hypothetical protein IB211_03084 [Intestinimonas butyriciproducens]|uniref:Uncharacterized protein n=1 Tax=Intestinimonas butyriciproducens TaxID=1297617 RepID=A0A0S2W831_9FIRM|nr:hypothetical protein IB211_03084 [Intestinimonas butyriciproducens]QBB67179.1 hypothetical protein SRB521_02922 [Intestinimonas butyriciproducens]
MSYLFALQRRPFLVPFPWYGSTIVLCFSTVNIGVLKFIKETHLIQRNVTFKN